MRSAVQHPGNPVCETADMAARGSWKDPGCPQLRMRGIFGNAGCDARRHVRVCLENAGAGEGGDLEVAHAVQPREALCPRSSDFAGTRFFGEIQLGPNEDLDRGVAGLTAGDAADGVRGGAGCGIELASAAQRLMGLGEDALSLFEGGVGSVRSKR
eukprot:gnl/Ergobibamus_cyprinoides/1833.p2 GENE.gnl/Ergobibamus_cyprinoides/1833~~gnl/Ergobibamus_cyprinoides/1833.p2  ORF type:complete len:156 (-),score=3.76 gnl/Ergobibamus_cyprinoides/1833:356-823(-)